MRVHIFGASGAGTTSLGQALAKDFGVPHFDSDDYYWQKTDPPFTTKNEVDERQRLLLRDIHGLKSWVLSGSMDMWSDPFLPLFDAAIFVTALADIRVQKLKKREQDKFGDRVLAGGDMYDEHEYFVNWAHQYEEGRLSGRSRKRHEDWIKTLGCPLLRVSNNENFERMFIETRNWLESLS